MTKARCPACGKPFYVIFNTEDLKVAMVEIACPEPVCEGSVRTEMPSEHYSEPAG